MQGHCPEKERINFCTGLTKIAKTHRQAACYKRSNTVTLMCNKENRLMIHQPNIFFCIRYTYNINYFLLQILQCV